AVSLFFSAKGQLKPSAGFSSKSLLADSLSWPKDFVGAPSHPVGPEELPFRLEFVSSCGCIGNRPGDALVFNEPVDDQSLLGLAREQSVECFALDNVAGTFLVQSPKTIDLVEIGLHARLLRRCGHHQQLAKPRP